MKKRDDFYISQILHRIDLIAEHLKGVNQAKFLKSSLHKAAVIRELEVIGEASRLVSEETKSKFIGIPWAQMIGMRNRLIHEYFSVDESIVWEVANTQLPVLKKLFEKAFLETAPVAHPWRNCPLGYFFVQEHKRLTSVSDKNPSGFTSVREHCRRNPSGKDQLYPDEIILISNSGVAASANQKIGQLKEPGNANNFDGLIKLWTKYWNDILSPKELLDPNVVKALFFSESSFNLKVKDQRLSKNNFARGPMQITDDTRKILADEKGELENHFMTLTANDVRKPELAIAAATRWLFHKKDLASTFLKREATWEEAVAHYKGYLRKKAEFKTQRGMKTFFSSLEKLNSEVKK